MSAASDELNVPAEVADTLRGIKAYLDAVYAELAALEAAVASLREEVRVERAARVGSLRRPPPTPPKAVPR